MGSSGGGSQPQTVTPGEAAQASVGTAGAGEMMGIANQPIEQYSQLATTEQLGPAQAQTQQALANQAAYQSAAAQRDIQSRIDPQAYAQREMRMQAANQRLSEIYGTSPGAFTFRSPQAYAIPGSGATPSLADLQANAGAIASNVSTASVDKSGANPNLVSPNNPQGLPQAIAPQSYYTT
jgi:hypothetical protein